MKLPEYDTADAVELAQWVREGDVSPQELLDAAIQRIESRNGALNAVVLKHYERARKRVHALPDGPLKGVPFLVKNLKLQLEGTITTDSTLLHKNKVATATSLIAERYEAAGLQILGKTNSPEFGIMGTTEPEMHGATKNPWHDNHTSGGSSGGSAAAVAAAMVPAAHSGDGGGSIRIPASCCGLFGMKPTRGRVSLAPFAGEKWSGLVQEHVVTRSVRDSALLLDIAGQPTIGEPYAAPPKERPFTEEVATRPQSLRIGFTTESLFGGDAHPDCRQAVQEAVALLTDLGHTVVEESLPFHREELVHAYFIVVAAGVARAVETTSAYANKRPKAKDFESATWILAQIGWATRASEYEWAREVMQRESRKIAEHFQSCDVYVTSTMGRPPATLGTLPPSAAEKLQLALLRKVGTRRLLQHVLHEIGNGKLVYTPNTQLFNQTGQPAMSVPLHWNAAGLPIGIQFAGRFGDEATLFQLAAQLENARPWAARFAELNKS